MTTFSDTDRSRPIGLAAACAITIFVVIAILPL
jgi:hypothetical protein